MTALIVPESLTLIYFVIDIISRCNSLEINFCEFEIDFKDQNTGDFSASAPVFIWGKCSIYQFCSLDMTYLPFGEKLLAKNKNNFIQTCQVLNHRI